MELETSVGGVRGPFFSLFSVQDLYTSNASWYLSVGFWYLAILPSWPNHPDLYFYKVFSGFRQELSKHWTHLAFVGSALRDIVMDWEMGQSFVSLHSKVMWSPLLTHFQDNWRVHLGFTTHQFSMLNIYRPYECRLKGRPNKPLVTVDTRC